MTKKTKNAKTAKKLPAPKAPSAPKKTKAERGREKELDLLYSTQSVEDALVFDGPDGVRLGTIKDPELKALMKDLKAIHKKLVKIFTRANKRVDVLEGELVRAADEGFDFDGHDQLA